MIMKLMIQAPESHSANAHSLDLTSGSQPERCPIKRGGLGLFLVATMTRGRRDGAVF